MNLTGTAAPAPALTARDARIAATLAEMASDAFITYRADGTRTRDGAGRVWYGMTATVGNPADPAARTWAYLLRRDFGSYAGSFTD